MTKQVRESTLQKRDSYRFVSTAAAIIYAILVLFPLYSVFVASSKTNREISRSPFGLPSNWSISNFVKAFESVDLLVALRNSTIAVGLALAITLVIAFPAAYAVARIKTRLAIAVEGFFVLGLLIPAIVVLVPVFLLAAGLGLLNKLSFLVLFYPATVLPVSVILLAGFIRSIPKELDESASMDGASRLQIMTKIVLPLSRPGLVLVLILNFISLWNEFLFALLLTNSKSRTVQVAISTFSGNEFRVDFGLVAAAVVITVAPTMILYLFAQKQIVGGGIAGALK